MIAALTLLASIAINSALLALTVRWLMKKQVKVIDRSTGEVESVPVFEPTPRERKKNRFIGNSERREYELDLKQQQRQSKTSL